MGAAVIERVVEVPFETGEVLGVLIGRHPGVAIELPFSAVSGRHARFFRRENGYCVEDLDSANGTFLGQRRLLPRAPEPVATGDRFVVADVELVFEGEIAATASGSAAAGTATLARRLVHDLFAGVAPAACAHLVVEGPPSPGRELALPMSGRMVRLGRGEDCDFVLADDDISREHAAFERSADGIVVRDLESKNGIEVQGQRISGPTKLCDGNLVRLGKTQLRVVDPEDRYLRRLRLSEAISQTGKERPEPEPAAANPGPVASPFESRLPDFAITVAVVALFLVVGFVFALAFAP